LSEFDITGVGHLVYVCFYICFLCSLWYCDGNGDLMQENWQKLIDLQHMLTGIDNIVLADRVCAMCLKYFAYYYYCYYCIFMVSLVHGWIWLSG